MNDHATLNAVDYAVFVLYMVATLGLGFAAGRAARRRPKDYFLGEKKLPWYVVGTSMVAADISSETFIANVGIAWQYGIAVATTSWNAWIIYTIFLFVFLPYYVRTGLYTMPQFLEQRYNSTCRYLFSISLVIGYMLTLLAGSLYAGGLVLENIFESDRAVSAEQSGLATTKGPSPFPLPKGEGIQTAVGPHQSGELSAAEHARFARNVAWGIIFFAVTTGAYTIYGGMKSSAWTDFMQMMVLLFTGMLLPILALRKTGGLFELAREMPEKFDIFLPATHEQWPWTGVFTGFLTVGLWYTCASQHIVQRVLSAKDEWHARMGVVTAGYLRILTPLFFAIPGIAAVKLFPTLQKPDQAYLMLIKSLIPTGLKGLMIAGMAAALMATVSSVLNSTSTLLTIDIYKKALRPNASEREQVIFGMVVAAVVLVISVFIAFAYIESSEALFRLVQRVFFYIAPPFAVVFLLGLVWRRATAPAAVVTIISGSLFLWLLQKGIWLNFSDSFGIHIPPLWDAVAWLTPYKKAYQHSALVCWIFCMVVMIGTSLVTPPPPPEKVERIIWNRSYLNLPPDERARYRGWKNFFLWWVLFVAIVLGIYGFFLWFSVARGV
jgi:solute:Na+ symporter, SSS family